MSDAICPECGPVQSCDEDGCCLSCGAELAHKNLGTAGECANWHGGKDCPVTTGPPCEDIFEAVECGCEHYAPRASDIDDRVDALIEHAQADEELRPVVPRGELKKCRAERDQAIAELGRLGRELGTCQAELAEARAENNWYLAKEFEERYGDCHGDMPISEVRAWLASRQVHTPHKRRLEKLKAELAAARALVDEQACDQHIWFPPTTVSEIHLQAALRRLYVVIEGKASAQCAVDALGEAQ